MLINGSELGGLRVHEMVGRGAMGEVYRGEQISLRRPVAIKRIAPHLAQEPEIIARFEREARCVAALQSANVVSIFEFGRYRDAQGEEHALLVMEWVEGGCNLSHLLPEDGGLPWEQACAIVKQVSDGLAAAHEAGVVHRDIKPDNILLSAKGIAKLADFGLASAADQTAMTTAGSIIGTPNYLSPEACEGQELSPKSDIYSLGATWFHLLTGRPPFLAQTTVALLRAHCDSQAPRVRELSTGVPPKISEFVDRCLAKRPEDRPEDARQIIAFLDDLPGIPDNVSDLQRNAHPRQDPSTVATNVPGSERTAVMDSSKRSPVSATDATLPAPGSSAAITAESSDGAAADPVDQTPAQTASAPATDATPKREPMLAMAGGGLLLLVAIIIVASASLAKDPVLEQHEQIEQAILNKQFGLALTSAADLIDKHPADPRSHEWFSAVVDAEVQDLIDQQRFADGLTLIDKRRQEYSWLQADAWRREVMLAEAKHHYETMYPNRAEQTWFKLLEEFPADLELKITYLEHYGRVGDRSASRGASWPAMEYAKATEGELPELVGETLIDYLADNPTYHERGDKAREVLLARYRDATVAHARERLNGELDQRIGAFRTLDQAQMISDADAILFHFHCLLEDKYSQQHRDSYEWMKKQVQDKDWANRYAASGLPAKKIETVPILDSWSDRQREVSAFLLEHFEPNIVDHLHELVAEDEKEHERWNAWIMLESIDAHGRHDPWRFHAASVQNFSPSYRTKAFQTALEFFRAHREHERSAEAVTALQACVRYLDEVITFNRGNKAWGKAHVADNAEGLRQEVGILLAEYGVDLPPLKIDTTDQQ